MDVAIKVRSRQDDHDRFDWMEPVKSRDRLMAAPCVQSDQEITVRTVVLLADDDALTQAPQNSRPAHCSDAIPLARARRRGTGHEDFHAGIIDSCRAIPN